MMGYWKVRPRAGAGFVFLSLSFAAVACEPEAASELVVMDLMPERSLPAMEEVGRVRDLRLATTED